VTRNVVVWSTVARVVVVTMRVAVSTVLVAHAACLPADVRCDAGRARATCPSGLVCVDGTCASRDDERPQSGSTEGAEEGEGAEGEGAEGEGAPPESEAVGDVDALAPGWERLILATDALAVSDVVAPSTETVRIATTSPVGVRLVDVDLPARVIVDSVLEGDAIDAAARPVIATSVLMRGVALFDTQRLRAWNLDEAAPRTARVDVALGGARIASCITSAEHVAIAIASDDAISVTTYEGGAFTPRPNPFTLAASSVSALDCAGRALAWIDAGVLNVVDVTDGTAASALTSFAADPTWLRVAAVRDGLTFIAYRANGAARLRLLGDTRDEDAPTEFAPATELTPWVTTFLDAGVVAQAPNGDVDTYSIDSDGDVSFATHVADPGAVVGGFSPTSFVAQRGGVVALVRPESP
jgi:hypothetical protein